MNEKLKKLNQQLAKSEARLWRAQHEEKITAVTKSFDFPPKSPRIFSSSFPSFSRFVSTKNTTRRTSVSI